MNTEVDFNLLQ